MQIPRFTFVILSIVAVFSFAACSAPLPSTELPSGRLVAPALEFPALRDYRGEIDLRIKDTGLDQAGVANLARIAQIDFVVLGDRAQRGDHDYGVAGFTSDILFVPGVSFDVDGGQMVAVNPHGPIDSSIPSSQLVQAIHDQGGVAIAAEPSRFKSAGDYALADGIEVYNQRAAWNAERERSLYLRAMFTTIDSFLLSLEPRPVDNLDIYDKLAAGARVVLVAGMGRPDDLIVAGSKVGRLDQLFLFYTTHLLATERNVEPLVDALKRGRAYVSFDLLGYVQEFAFFARDGEAKTMMGDEVRMTPTLKLQTELPAVAEQIALLRDGEQVAAANHAQTLEYPPTQPGTYRIEASRRGHLWILSNPVYVR